MTSMNAVEKKMNEEAETMMYEKRDPIHGANDEDSDVNIEQITDNNDELSSTCSTPTLMEIKNIRKVIYINILSLFYISTVGSWI